MTAINRNRKKLGIYIHIPFCIRKCEYCDFLSGPAKEEVRNRYMEQLLLDIKSVKDKEIYEVDTIFIGGGTPTVIPPQRIQEVLFELHNHFTISSTVEITIEANPGTVTKESLDLYRKSGINRISFGLQSMDDGELELLGRIHRKRDFLKAFTMAREAGFTNINIDLMSGLPGQTVESFRNTLRAVGKLDPEHISVYSLILEEGTPFYEKYREDEQAREQGREPELLPGEDAEREMYENTKTILEEYGYYRYEISNYAKDGFECRHNLKYWDRQDYLGLGLGAASFLNPCRFKKTESLDAYLAGDFNEKDLEYMDGKDAMAEFMFLGLRKERGVSRKDFFQCFQKEMEQIYGELFRKLTEEGLLRKTETGYALTSRGMDVSNRVFTEFL